MKKNLVRALVGCFILSFINSSYGYEVTEENLLEISNSLNKTLPRQLDKATSVMTTKVKPGLRLEFIYEINANTTLQGLAKLNRVSKEKLTRGLVEKYGSLHGFFRLVTKNLAAKERKQLCTNPSRGANRLLGKGVTITHIYYDESGQFLGSNLYNKKTCP